MEEIMNYFLKIGTVYFNFDEDVENIQLTIYDKDSLLMEGISIYLNPKYAGIRLDRNFINDMIYNSVYPEGDSVAYYDSYIDEEVGKYIVDNNIDIFDCEIIVPFCKESAELVKNNSYKNVVIDKLFDFGRKSCEEILETFGDRDNINVALDGEHSYIPLSTYKNTIYSLGEMVDKIKKYDLSPLEQVVYAYDLVRDRVYTKEEDGNAYSSRELSGVLSGDKIVCAGYVSLFNSILDELGIKAMMYTYSSSVPGKAGHARSLVHLDDEKYGIDGYFIFDPTWDSKRAENSTDYLSSYEFFCQNHNAFTLHDSVFHRDLYDDTFTYDCLGLVKETEKFINEFNSVSSISELSDKSKEFYDSLNFDKTNKINFISSFFSGKPIFRRNFLEYKENNFDKLILSIAINANALDGLKEKVERFNKNVVPSDVLFDAIYRVRKIEYYEDTLNYPFDVSMFDDIVDKKSMTADFLRRGEFYKGLALSTLYCSDDDPEVPYFSDRLINREESEKDLTRVKFTKVLKLVSESRKK